MNVSSSYRIHGPHALQGPHSARGAAPTGQASSAQGSQPADRVDISAAAEASLAGTQSDFRADLVARIQSEIASGTYETAAKLDAAVDRLLDEMG
jgi:negative regulator of flagellin synthesis FlgM